MSSWVCRIICARGGHPERLIDRFIEDDGGEPVLALSWTPQGENYSESGRRDRSTFVEDGYAATRDGWDYTWERYAHTQLRCPVCSLEVRLGGALTAKIGRGIREAGLGTLDLSSLATIVSKQ